MHVDGNNPERKETKRPIVLNRCELRVKGKG